MKTDANKKITGISYNHLNKPNVITTDSGSISYVYDAGGNRLQKKIAQNGTSKIYDYIGNFVYEDSVLQYMLNEEGRARPVANINTNHYTRYVYDYFIKDHLGNVRSTVTAEPINSDYFAGHEIAMANVEQLIFDNIPNVREGKPGTINPNDGMAAQLVAADPDKRIGTAIMLRVMPGDKFTIDAQAFYEGSTVPEETIGAGDVISALSSALLGGSTYAGVPIAELPENVQTVAQIFSNPGLVGQLEKVETKNYDPTAPKAHLNYLFFDDQMNLNAGLSGKIQVQANGSTGSWQPVQPGGNGATGTQICNCDINGPGTPGVVLIYVDNQSIGKDVWFDDLHIEHYTSSVLSEDHYYPFGLTVSIDQNTSVNTPQPYKYNGKELEKSFGLEYYDYINRTYDPQIGRWLSIDPMSELMRRHSPYSYAFNNPVRFIDPDGMVPTDFYNLDAKMVKHVEDDKNDKKIVLTDSKKEAKVDNAINSGAVINVPTNAVVGQMSNAFDRTEKTGNEHGFVVGEQGKSSITVEGTEGKIKSDEWKTATQDLVKKGDMGSYDVHTHPLGDNAESGEYGATAPSETDMTNPTFSTGQPNAVLGYLKITIPPPSGTIGGTPTYKYSRGIGFYNQNGLIHKGTEIKFDKFAETVKKINGQ